MEQDYSQTPERLCAVCNDLFTSFNEIRPHHSSLIDLQTAVDGDCYICVRMKRAMEHKQSYQAAPASLWPLISSYGDTKDNLVYVNIYTSDMNISSAFVGIKLREAIDFGMQMSLAPSIRSHTSFETARKWVNQCLGHHELCRRKNHKGNIPKRLMCVEQDRGTMELSAHISYGGSLPADTQYLSVSHCWGLEKFVTTTRERLPFFEKSIPIDKLPSTFQDALVATIELGYHYVWIDSLCIVQDDLEDWLTEASKMADVYRHAVCNLSIAGFSNGIQGFLLKRRHNNPTLPIVNLELDHLEHGSNGLYVIAEESAAEDVVHQPLFSRAWILQEQILASRALHFGADQIYWECPTTFASEVWPDGWDVRGSKHPLYDKNNLTLWPFWHLQSNQLGTARNDEILDSWSTIVNNYSERHITCPSDRLPALSGIASEFAKFLQTEYCFGLWKSGLFHMLLWYTRRTFEPSTPFHSLRDISSPSWSWVSHSEFQPFLPSSHYPGKPFSEILSSENGEIRIRGPLMSFETLETASLRGLELEKPSIEFTTGRYFKLKLSFDPLYLYYARDWNSEWLTSQEDKQTMLESPVAKFLWKLAIGCYFIPFRYYRDDPHYIREFGELECSIQGLVLKREENRGNGVYKRVGIAEYEFQSLASLDNKVWLWQQQLTEQDSLTLSVDGLYDIAIV